MMKIKPDNVDPESVSTHHLLNKLKRANEVLGGLKWRQSLVTLKAIWLAVPGASMKVTTICVCLAARIFLLFWEQNPKLPREQLLSPIPCFQQSSLPYSSLCMHMYVYAHMQLCTSGNLCLCIYTCAFVCMCVPEYVCAYMQICVCMFICACVCMGMYVYIFALSMCVYPYFQISSYEETFVASFYLNYLPLNVITF